MILGNPEAEVDESRCKLKRTFLPGFISQNITESNFLLDLGKVPSFPLECDPVLPESEIYEFSCCVFIFIFLAT